MDSILDFLDQIPTSRIASSPTSLILALRLVIRVGDMTLTDERPVRAAIACQRSTMA
jgi:hypothetical protein